MLFYSPSRRGFFSRALHADALPADAVPITAAEHEALLAGLAAGQVVVLGPEGRPSLAAPPPPPPERLAAQARARRDALLAASDWTQLADAPLGEAARAAWRAWRQALRDLPAQPGWPAAVEWPARPGEEA